MIRDILAVSKGETKNVEDYIEDDDIGDMNVTPPILWKICFRAGFSSDYMLADRNSGL